MIADQLFALRTLLHTRVVVIGVVVASVVGSFLVALLFALVPELLPSPEGTMISLLRLNAAVPLGALVLGVSTTISDARHGLVHPAILDAGGRRPLWRAKLVAVVGVAGALAVVATASAWGATAAVFFPPAPGVVLEALAGATLHTVGWAVVGVGVASIVQHPAVAIAIPVAIAYVIEPIILGTTAFAPGDVARVAELLPFTAGAEIVVAPASDGMFTTSGPLWASYLVFIAGVVLVAAAGSRRFGRADLGADAVA